MSPNDDPTTPSPSASTSSEAPPGIPELALRQTVFICGGNRFWIGKERFNQTPSHARAHLCLYPCDSAHAMEGPAVAVGTVVRFKSFQGTDFAVTAVEMSNATYQIIKDTRRKAPKGREIITRICLEAVDLLEAQRERDEELSKREWMRRGLEHLRGDERGDDGES